MSGFYIGDGLILYILEDGDYKPMACLTTCGMSESLTFIETCKTSIEGAKTFIPDLSSYSLSFDGLLTDTTTIGGTDAKVSWDKLHLLQRSKTKIQFKLDNGLVIEGGYGYIATLDITAATSEFISFTGSITGIGELNDPNTIFNDVFGLEFA